MANETQYVRGVTHWCKLLGAPRKNNFDDYREWTMDLSPDADGVKLFKRLGIMDRLKDPKDGEDRGRFISFRQREYRSDGVTKNDPVRVVDAADNPWPENVLIGNGSTVDVKFAVKDYGKGKKKGVYIRAVRVLEHVPYERSDFAPLDEDDEFFAKAGEKAVAAPSNAAADTFEEDFGLEPEDDLDDEIPE